ncbi:hypothetical protein GCM10020367_72900 [Streptomyces sannanensis]|uniref:HEAT repeat domain-containing protein n=1 Tax=Streptomyces sannanensis TaxID=285536 RepID=A0ABP6SPA2_9ACTN
MNVLTEALERLSAQEARERDDASAALGDLLHCGSLGQQEAELAVSHLMALALDDPDHSVQESALNSIGETPLHRDLPLRLVEALAPALAGMTPDLLEHAIGILGATRAPAARTMIEPFLEHAVGFIREAANITLAELPVHGSQQIPTAR